MSKTKNQLLPLILSVLILSLLTAYWIFAWDEPDSSPPLGNVDTPINIGSTAQTKTGDLTLSGLYLNAVGSEGNISNLNSVIGYDDLFLKGDSSEASIVYIAGSQISSYAGGAERMKIDSTGDVYISGLVSCDTIDTDASGKMVCGTDEAGAGGIEGGGTLNYLSKFTDTGTIGNSQVFDDGTGVGIGTVTPAAKLDLADAGTAAGAQFLRVGDDSFLTDIDAVNTLGVYGIQDGTQAHIKLGSLGPIISGYDGNVGIGIATPAQELEVVDGGYVILHEGFWGQTSGDTEDTDIWGISSSFYPSHGTTGSRYGIKWDNVNDRITFVGAGATKAYVDINDGNTYLAGDLTVAGGNLNLDDTANAQNSKIDWYATDGDTGSVQYTTSDRWEWSNGSFYIMNTVPTTWIYSDTIYLGESSATNIMTRDNELYGSDWIINYNEAGSWGIGDLTPDYKLDVAGSVGLDGDLTVGGGDIFGKNSEWIDIGDAETNSVQISNHLIIGANDTIDDDTTIGGLADDWISFSGYIEMRSNTDSYGIILRDKDTTSYLNLTQIGGYSYLSDSDTSSNYFLRGNADDVHIKDDLTVGDDITVTGNVVATSNALSSCAWECAGGEGDVGEFSNICNSGKIAAGIKIKKDIHDIFLGVVRFVYDVCVYCCEL